MAMAKVKKAVVMMVHLLVEVAEVGRQAEIHQAALAVGEEMMAIGRRGMKMRNKKVATTYHPIKYISHHLAQEIPSIRALHLT